MSLLIPTDSRPFNTQVVQMGDRNFLLDTLWNTREQVWYLNLNDLDGVPLIQGIKIICQAPLLRNLASEERPIGEIFALTETTDTTPPNRNELGPGLRVELWFFTHEELTT